MKLAEVIGERKGGAVRTSGWCAAQTGDARSKTNIRSVIVALGRAQFGAHLFSNYSNFAQIS
jgi:hypothetical protein